jgi:hypothetical protein
LGRRDSDERPPVEILGADPGVSSTQQVAMGPPRKPGRRRRSLAVAVLVGALVVGGIALSSGGDDEPEHPADDEPRDNQDHIELGKRTTATSGPTSTTLPIGPPLGIPVEATLVLFGQGAARAVDLRTGEAWAVALPAEAYGAVPVPGGLVMVVSGDARFYPLSTSTSDPEPIVLGPADQVYRSGVDRIWLADLPPEGEPLAPASVAVRQVDQEGNVHRSFEVGGQWVAGATSDAVLLARGGRVFAADEEGVRSIGIGNVIGTNGDAALIVGCEEDGSCALRRQPTDGRGGRELLEVSDPDAELFDPSEGLDGRLALVATRGGVLSTAHLFAADGSSLGEVDLGGLITSSSARWLPDDLGLLTVSASGVHWLRPDGDRWHVEDLEIADAPERENLYVVTP